MREFLSIREVAEYLHVDYKTIYRLIQQGQLAAGRVGSLYRVRRQDVEAYFERQQQVLTQEAARAAQLKCGRCLRLLAPYEVAGVCEAPECDEALCRTCWEDDPDHRCRAHVLSREARLRQAQAQLQRGEIPLLLTSEAAHRRQMLYLNRIEAKLRSLGSILHPLQGRSVRVSDWKAIETRTEAGAQGLAVGYPGEEKPALLPTNPRITYRLPRGLVLEVAVFSDVVSHLKFGFVTRPTSEQRLLELLSEAMGRAEVDDSLWVLALAATAGWDAEATALIEGAGAVQRPFHHRLVTPLLVDLAGDRLIYNRTDERLDHLASLFSPEMAMDVVQAVMAKVESKLKATRTGVYQSEVVDQDRVAVEAVAEAFDRLAATGRYKLRKEDNGDRVLER